MGKFIWLLVVSILAILLGSAYAVNASENQPSKIDAKVLSELDNNNDVRVIVVMKDNMDKSMSIASVENDIEPEKITHEFSSFNGFSAKLNSDDVEKLEANDNVKAIYYDIPVHADLQDSVPIINASSAWNLQVSGVNLTGKGQTICIIDTGVDYTHPDLGNCAPSQLTLNGTNESQIVESPHPYPDGYYNNTWKITKTGWSKIAVHFANISLEGPDSPDEIIIYNSNMSQIAQYHNKSGVITDLWTPYSNGDTIYVQLKTDISGAGYGFYIDLVRNGTTDTTYDWSACTKVIGGWDFVNNDGNPMDDNGHGTHVAGIVAANGGIKGVAPDASIVAAKSLPAGGSGYFSDSMAAIEYCTNISADYNISVISMSLGTSEVYSDYCDDKDYFFSLISSAINNSVAKNIAVVIAAGNVPGSTTNISAPACIYNAIPVGSIQKDNSTFNYNRNWMVQLIAPGVSINSTKNGGGYEPRSGTSMATPHVAGAFAIVNQYLKATGRTKTPQQIESIFNSTGRRIYDSGGSNLNYSRIDVYNALLSIASAPTVSLMTPVNGTTNNSGGGINQIFTCYANSLVLKNATFYMWSSTGIYNQTPANVSGSNASISTTVYNIGQGTYSWNCLFYDQSGTSAFAPANFTFTYDTTPPAITVTSPKNQTWYNGAKFNVTLNDPGQCNFSLNSQPIVSMSQSSSTTFYYYNLSFDNTTGGFNSSNNVTFYCNDSAGNTNSSLTIPFGIDKTPPTVTSTGPDNLFAVTGTATFSYTVSDDKKIGGCDLIIGSAVAASNASDITTGTNTILKAGLPTGNYSWYINCTDQAGNRASSSNGPRTIYITASSSGDEDSGDDSGNGGDDLGNESSENVINAGEYKDVTINLGSSYLFSIGTSESHRIRVSQIFSNYVEFIISTDPVTFVINNGATKRIDANGDGTQDLELTLLSMTSSTVTLRIKVLGGAAGTSGLNLTTSSTTATEGENKTTLGGLTWPTNLDNNAYAFIALAALLVGVCVIRVVRYYKHGDLAKRIKGELAARFSTTHTGKFSAPRRPEKAVKAKERWLAKRDPKPREKKEGAPRRKRKEEMELVYEDMPST